MTTNEALHVPLKEVTKHKIGWLATLCSCGQQLTWDMEHVYGVSKIDIGFPVVPKSMTHGECPICKKILNVRIEVWE